MKVETRVLDYESTVRGDRVAMSIDESALSHIMSVLTDLYSDPEMAVIREYATNALDAHVSAGIRRPIEVTTPTPLSPFYRVRDYGEGLNADDIRNVFSRYGTSTKRESNDVVGMLGLGCKSALTYSDSFTLTGIRDGIATEVLISRDEDGSGSMVIVEERASDEESGVSILVPAKSGNAFETKSADFFRYWTPGTVHVNGREPKRIDGLWLSPTILLTTEADCETIVMGNVPYPVPNAKDVASVYVPGTGYMRHRMVAFVNIGDVTFTPSRESLQTTKRTTATIDACRAQVSALIETSVAKQIADAASPSDARRIFNEGRAIGYKGKGIYKGREVATRLDREPRDSTGGRLRSDPANAPSESFLVAGTSSRKKSGERSWDVDFNVSVWFTGFDARELSPTKREKLQLWSEREGVTLGRMVFVSSLSASERFWLDGARIVAWSDVDAIKIDRGNRPAVNGRPRGAYTVRIDGTTRIMQADDIDCTRPLYWTNGNEYSVGGHDAIRSSIIEADAIVVALPANRIEKFTRDFAHAEKLDHAARRIALAWWDSQMRGTRKAFAYQTHNATEAAILAKIDPARFADPDIRERATLAAVDTSGLKKGRDKYRVWLPTVDPLPQYSHALAERYPLASSLQSYNMRTAMYDHFTLYVNAAYAASIAATDAAEMDGNHA